MAQWCPLPSLVEEDVHDRVADAIHYAGWLLERIDPTHRLSRVALARRLDGVGFLSWRTRAEVAASLNRAPMNPSGRESADTAPVVLSRAALLMDGARQAEDRHHSARAARGDAVATQAEPPGQMVPRRMTTESVAEGAAEDAAAVHRRSP